MKNTSKEPYIANIIRLLLIIFSIRSIFIKNYLNTFTALLTLWLTFLPYIIAKKNHITLPKGFQVAILLFIFAAQYLGELKEYYFKFWWWDLMLHTFSGIILGFIGYLLVYILNKETKVDISLNPLFMALFSFTFAVSIGAVWEIFEFSMDTIFGLNMQKSGLVDTMSDIIADCLGGLFSAFCGYMYEINGQNGWFKRAFNAFKNLNSKIFNRNINKNM